MNSLSPLRCPHGCKSVKQGFKLVRRYGPHYTPLYECLRCGQQFSGRYDSVFSGFHTDEQTIYRVLKALSEGIGIRAAARIFDLDKNTVVLILERAAEHCKRGSEQLIKNYPMDECQLDELGRVCKLTMDPRYSSIRLFRKAASELLCKHALGAFVKKR